MAKYNLHYYYKICKFLEKSCKNLNSSITDDIKKLSVFFESLLENGQETIDVPENREK